MGEEPPKCCKKLAAEPHDGSMKEEGGCCSNENLVCGFFCEFDTYWIGRAVGMFDVHARQPATATANKGGGDAAAGAALLASCCEVP